MLRLITFTSVKMTITKKNINNKYWQGCEEKEIVATVIRNINRCSRCGKWSAAAAAEAAAAKPLQSCPTLCDPIDVSPPGSPVPGILQARTLEWVAISFSSA